MLFYHMAWLVAAAVGDAERAKRILREEKNLSPKRRKYLKDCVKFGKEASVLLHEVSEQYRILYGDLRFASGGQKADEAGRATRNREGSLRKSKRERQESSQA